MRVGAKKRFVCGLGLVLVAPLVGLMSSGAQASGGAQDLVPVDVVEVSGLIDNVVAQNMEQAIIRSQENGSQALIFQMNSKGAVVNRDRMAQLAEAISRSEVPVAIWVGPSGARALGLPAQLLAVADVTAMAPGARIGRTGSMLTVNDVELSFGDAKDAVYTKTVGFIEARDLGILKFSNDDRGVPVLRNMLFALDGIEARGVVLDTVVDVIDPQGQVTRESTTVRFFKLGLVPRLLHTVASPESAYLLLTIGLALLLFEFFTAGIGVAGLVGAITLILGSIGIGELPMNGFGIALLLLAMISFAVDVQVGIPRLWTGGGLILYIIASLIMFRPVDGLVMRPSWITLSVGIVGIALTFIVGMPSMVRTRFATPTIGRQNLVGATGTAVGDIAPDGVVMVDGAQWRARTNRATPLTTNSPIRVVDIDGVTLQVEPIDGGARDYREKRATQ